MEISGTVVSILPEINGTSGKGAWRKQEFILETEGQYPKKVCIMMWGDKIDQFALTEGDVVTASIDAESREYNQRWYTDLKAWKVEKGVAGSAQPATPNNAPGDFGPPPNPAFAPSGGSDDDLPF
ncbi:DUF3127 domain-containing protein [Persicitalea sp.]|uniref:DUF3127 domain-containing protein n=1 Tax=Persicitalea sp. TaxID=3100273 RepID=UPI0035931A85